MRKSFSFADIGKEYKHLLQQVPATEFRVYVNDYLLASLDTREDAEQWAACYARTHDVVIIEA